MTRGWQSIRLKTTTNVENKNKQLGEGDFKIMLLWRRWQDEKKFEIKITTGVKKKNQNWEKFVCRLGPDSVRYSALGDYNRSKDSGL